MLVRFSVENYRSFKKRQVFSMAAGKHTRHKEQILSINGKRLLKAGILFGANAAGKSNLIKAVNFSRNVALKQITAGQILYQYMISQIHMNRNDHFARNHIEIHLVC